MKRIAQILPLDSTGQNYSEEAQKKVKSCLISPSPMSSQPSILVKFEQRHQGWSVYNRRKTITAIIPVVNHYPYLG